MKNDEKLEILAKNRVPKLVSGEEKGHFSLFLGVSKNYGSQKKEESAKVRSMLELFSRA
jgi:hypothetical protein